MTEEDKLRGELRPGKTDGDGGPASLGKAVYAGYFADRYTTNPVSTRFQWLLKRFFGGTPSGLRVLEVGMGDGGVLPMLAGSNRVTGVDASETGVASARQKGIEAFHRDASWDPLPGGEASYDLVIALEVIEHLENPFHLIAEIQRVLVRDGTLIVSIPNPRTGHPLIYPALFELHAFRDFLLNAGFEVRRIYPYQVLSKRNRRWRWIDEGLLRAVAKLSGGRATWFYDRAWSWCFELRNADPRGAVDRFRLVCDASRGAYDPALQRPALQGPALQGPALQGPAAGAGTEASASSRVRIRSA